MPRYFFDTVDRSRFHDDYGVELAGLHEARLLAIQFAGECAASDPALLSETQDFKVEVRNGDDIHLFTVTTFITEGPAVMGKM